MNEADSLIQKEKPTLNFSYSSSDNEVILINLFNVSLKDINNQESETRLASMEESIEMSKSENRDLPMVVTKSDKENAIDFDTTVKKTTNKRGRPKKKRRPLPLTLKKEKLRKREQYKKCIQKSKTKEKE